jgi:hypothetical protein
VARVADTNKTPVANPKYFNNIITETSSGGEAPGASKFRLITCRQARGQFIYKPSLFSQYANGDWLITVLGAV